MDFFGLRVTRQRRLPGQGRQFKDNNFAERDLSGDRDIEWSYVAAKIGSHTKVGSRVLDFGCAGGGLAFAAAGMGAKVLAIDLMPSQLKASYPEVDFRQTDVTAIDGKCGPFDLIINCSTIEHVGLPGRYNSTDEPDGDIEVMRKLCTLMNPDGLMFLTLPVGIDMTVKPWHRIYGHERFPRLIEGYKVVESKFWRKNDLNIWTPCSRNEAFTEIGNERYYALGLMVLERSR